MELSEDLACLFSATVDEQYDSYVIEVPKIEVENGSVDPSEVYKLALVSTPTEASSEESNTTGTGTDRTVDHQSPPVSVGEHRIVEIDEIGDKGDGLARVERGFVVIVPETEVGDRVRIKINHVNETVAFGDVVERFRY